MERRAELHRRKIFNENRRTGEEPYISEMNKSGPEDDAIAGTTPLTKF